MTHLKNARHESKLPTFSLGMGISPCLDIMELPKSKCCDLAPSVTCKEGMTCSVTLLCTCCTFLFLGSSTENAVSRKIIH